jgi:Rieske Fe-S protein
MVPDVDAPTTWRNLMSHPTTRRTVLAGAAGISAATLLAACGSDEAPPPPAAAPPPPGETLANVNDIPVSGGIIYADRDVVVTQPSLGEFRAFGAKCTHKGCVLAAVRNNIISCDCHNAKYSATDGAVESGPATEPLPARKIRVDGNTIELLTS